MFPSAQLAILAFCGALSVWAITPSNLPACAVECYVKGITNMKLAFDDYEGQCRSTAFQFAMRGCVATQCQNDEYLFVAICKRNMLMADDGCCSKVLLREFQCQFDASHV